MFQLSLICPKCQTKFVAVDALTETREFRCASCETRTLIVQQLVGFIYILSNELMPGIVKIGFTERTVAERISELSAHTGVAVPYKEVASFPVIDPSKFERTIHRDLARYRVNENREFFRLSPEQASAAVRQALGIPAPAKASESQSCSKWQWTFE